MPVISLVGRPNVGKSTLFNRLSKSRQALVSDFEGLTRDRQYAEILFDEDSETFATIIDTGGLTNQDNIIDSGIQTQVLNALEESNVIYFIVSSRDGIIGLDREIASQLRKLKKDIVLVCNKAEGLDPSLAAEFYELGMGEPILISAEHGQGIGDLIDYTLPLLPKEVENEEEEDIEGIAVAVLGRPNVGKSTLINRILGEERVLAIDLPGTTRDSIYIPFEREGQKYTLIDTAGIRRKRSTHEKIEIFSIIKAREAMERSHVVVLMLDASEGVTEQDATLLGMIADRGRALMIVINKWDGLDEYQKQEVKRKLDVKLSFVNYASVHYISALHGSGVGKLFAPIITAYTHAGAEFSTPNLNKILEKANHGHQPPPVKGRRLKIKYVNQTDVFPPTLTFHGNHLHSVPNAYERYLKNFFINALKLTNTPLRIEYKSGDNPFKDKKNVLNARQIAKRRRLMKFIKKK
ncbi:GTP-binding protein EngA [uncultured Gammaproteobacteria bacterium]|uniref:ribosome biogenesis GTPase Der n=1 Tax=Bathymodiolus heckerae thiotrophic gill symbiont TaxID=1052212 RepID=UPI0010BBE628|nr:ribosome biogenesis GTPase Der [Bathymodiolus heckerae thiotrophic gill symbiont]CAC9459311.1 GTP-binding protein EngA [uncultured Gammaproteobacteria bacterium]SMN13590.1 GTP-binding protein EngA [Bathymodiolus heckerae thiotrophic gill symbiont]SMN15147.1 GTP-binding protein EngA [uncultured Candidatus Thioglobus sp.]